MSKKQKNISKNINKNTNISKKKTKIPLCFLSL
jgi:hypothetical protein